MKRHIVFVSLLAAATALFVIGDAQARPNGPNGPRGPAPYATAQQTGPAPSLGCRALAASDERPDFCVFRRNQASGVPCLGDRTRDRVHLRWWPTAGN